MTGSWSEWRGPRSGWSRRTKVITFVVTGVLAIAWAIGVGYVQERADGVTAPARPATSSPAPARCVPPGGGNQTCKRWAQSQVERSGDGKLGNSVGVHKKFMSKKKWNRLMRSAVKRVRQGRPGASASTPGVPPVGGYVT